MSNLNKIVNLLARSESYVQEDVDLKLTLENTIDIYSKIPEIPYNLNFPARQVPVAALSEDAPFKFGVAAGVLGLFMEMNHERDIKDSMEQICEANQIAMEDTCIVFDSDDSLRHMVNESRQMDDTDPYADKSNKAIIKLGNLIKTIEGKGVNVAKEPVMQIQDADDSNIVTIDRSTGGFGKSNEIIGKDTFYNS